MHELKKWSNRPKTDYQNQIVNSFRSSILLRESQQEHFRFSLIEFQMLLCWNWTTFTTSVFAASSPTFHISNTLTKWIFRKNFITYCDFVSDVDSKESFHRFFEPSVLHFSYNTILLFAPIAINITDQYLCSSLIRNTKSKKRIVFVADYFFLVESLHLSLLSHFAVTIYWLDCVILRLDFFIEM